MSNQQSRLSLSGLVGGKARNSGLPEDDKEVLEHALASFQSTLTDDERVKLQQMKGSPCDSVSIIRFTHELDGLDVSRRGRSMATTLHSLLQSVQQFYQIVDTYVSSHPEIAALVWGSVKLAFMVLGNFTSYFQKFSELLRGFDQLVPRFAEYRRLFPDSSRLRRATYEFQTTIVRCCSQMILITRRPWQKQLIVALSQSFQTEMRPLVDDIRAKAKFVKEEVELAKAQADQQEQLLQSQERCQAGESRREVSRWFAKSHEEIQSLRQEQLVRAREYKWDILLDKLSHYDYAAAFKSARGKRHNGTAEWVFRTTEFENWQNNDASAILHLAGKIGCGKTVLAANIVDYLVWSGQPNTQAVAFFFVRFDDPPSQQSECIIRSIVRQLFSHEANDGEILHLLETASDRLFDNDSLLALWSEKIKPFKRFFLILDGFDECTLPSRKTILNSLSNLSDACQKTTRIKVLLSSRFSVREEIDRMGIMVIRKGIDAQNINADLTKYASEILKDRISTGDFSLGDETLSSDILQAVSIGGEGMFLWVFLTLEDIFCQTSDSEIREALNHIPRKLSETFDRALQRITNNGKTKIAQAIFNWTATVRLPLTLHQLKESLAIRIGQKHSEPARYPTNIHRLSAWCENLVYVEETDETVRFSHHSIRDYLLRDSKTFRIHQQDWDHQIGEMCLTYLDFNDFKKALGTRARPNAMDVANYPVGITSETVRKLLPGVKRSNVVTSVQRWFPRSSTSSFINEPQVDARVAEGSVCELGYPFFQYASDQWIFHTTRFRSGNAETWGLWTSMVRTELMTWIDLHWEPEGSILLDEDWMLPSERSSPNLARDQLLRWHKAILLAAFTQHHPLMDQTFSVLRQHHVNLNPRLLRALMSTRKILIGLNSPIPLTLGISDIHATVVYTCTRYIAFEGWLEVSQLPKEEECDLEPTKEHLDGIYQDVCDLLCKGRWAPGQSRQERRLLAQMAVAELDDSLRQDIKNALTSSRNYNLLAYRTVQGKTILNLAFERGEEWRLIIADWILSSPGSSLSIDSLMRDSLRLALKAKDEASVSLLLQMKHVNWTNKGTLDNTTTWYAVRFRQMSSKLRKRFIDSVIQEAPTRVIAEKEEEKMIREIKALINRQTDVRETIDGPIPYWVLKEVGFPEPWERDEMIRQRFGPGFDFEDSDAQDVTDQCLFHASILEAVERLYWEFAVVLYERGARLVENELEERLPCESLNIFLSCIARREGSGKSCYLAGLDIEDSQIGFCQQHITLAPAILAFRERRLRRSLSS